MVATLALACTFLTARFGLHWSEVCFKGNHLDAVSPLLKRLKYRIVATWKVDSKKAGSLMNDAFSDNAHVRKAAYFTGGWTHVSDPEMVLMLEEKELAGLSKSLKTQVVTWVSESVSDSYGFSFYNDGALIREVLAIRDSKESVESKGKRIAAEGKINWKDAGEDDIMDLIKRLGPAFDGLESPVQYVVYDLRED